MSQSINPAFEFNQDYNNEESFDSMLDVFLTPKDQDIISPHENQLEEIKMGNSQEKQVFCIENENENENQDQLNMRLSKRPTVFSKENIKFSSDMIKQCIENDLNKTSEYYCDINALDKMIKESHKEWEQKMTSVSFLDIRVKKEVIY